MLRQVATKDAGIGAGASQSLGELLGAFRMIVATENQRDPGGGEGLGNSDADQTTGPGDQGHPLLSARLLVRKGSGHALGPADSKRLEARGRRGWIKEGAVKSEVGNPYRHVSEE